MRALSHRRNARRRGCAMARMRLPTGRCSTPSSTRRAAQAGCRSTTAAGSEWASPSTRARSRSPTAPRRGPCGSGACCSPPRALASSATPTPAIRRRSMPPSATPPGPRPPREKARGATRRSPPIARQACELPVAPARSPRAEFRCHIHRFSAIGEVVGTRGVPTPRTGDTICLTGAAQVLRPPEDGLPYLRHDRADQLRLDPVPVLIAGGEIAAFEEGEAALRIDASGCAVVPGFVDCHTHLPFVGWRAEEYERRVGGASYEEIAREGGGIASSAKALADAPHHEVLGQASALAGEMLAWGTTAFETKSGYGLSAQAEMRALRLAGELEAMIAQTTVDTALLAHAVPRGYSADAWMDEVESLLPRVVEETPAVAVDIYVEAVALSKTAPPPLGEAA